MQQKHPLDGLVFSTHGNSPDDIDLLAYKLLRIQCYSELLILAPGIALLYFDACFQSVGLLQSQFDGLFLSRAIAQDDTSIKNENAVVLTVVNKMSFHAAFTPIFAASGLLLYSIPPSISRLATCSTTALE